MYIILLVYLLFCAYIKNKKITFFNAIIVFLLMGGWYFPAYDWINYHDFYANIDTESIFNPIFEPGFTILMKITNFLGLEYHYVYVFSNMIIYFLIYRYSIGFKRSNFIFFIIFAMFGFVLFTEQIRQGIALALILYASRKNKFIIYAFAACLFHYSALFVVIFELLVNRKKYNKTMLILFSIVVTIMAIVLSLLINIKFGLYDFVANKLKNYFNGDVLSPSFIIGIILFSIFAFLILYKKDINIANKKTQYISVFLILCGIPFPVFNRFTYYCFPYIIPDIENAFDKYSQRALLLSSIIFIISIRMVVSPIYWPVMQEYNFYLPPVSTHPDYDSLKEQKCKVLNSNGVNNFC